MTFGLMLHHFVEAKGGNAPPGAISAESFRGLIGYLAERYTIVSAEEYEIRALHGKLGERDICLTFDDALKSQATVAAPILDEFGIKAFFFVYSGAFGESPPLMEFARDFRSCFASTNDYYAEFLKAVEREMPSIPRRLDAEFPEDYLKDYPFYSRQDRRYRFLRDHLLKNDYDGMVVSMMRSHGYDVESRRSEIFMSDADLSELVSKGHVLGLHSTSHPMQMQGLDPAVQRKEYEDNVHHLRSIVDEPITAMSHPCGNYGRETLDILEDMGIRLGFRSSMTPSRANTLLEIPRDDHCLVMERMEASRRVEVPA